MLSPAKANKILSTNVFNWYLFHHLVSGKIVKFSVPFRGHPFSFEADGQSLCLLCRAKIILPLLAVRKVLHKEHISFPFDKELK